MDIRVNNIEYTNLISEGQEAERFVGLISPLDVIGYPFDYSGKAISEINKNTNEAFDLLHEHLLGEDVHRAHFSFLSFNVKSLDFISIENIMRQHKFTSIVYDLSKRFSDLITIKYDRVYYTRLYKMEHNSTINDIHRRNDVINDIHRRNDVINDIHRRNDVINEQANFNKKTSTNTFKGLTRTEKNKMAFPTDTTGDDPASRVKRGEFGPLLASKKIRLVNEMNKTYGNKFDKESDWTYVLHVDFRVYFNFNNLKVLQHAMKDRQWTGALLTFINWTARHKVNLKKNWEYSERWYIDYADYQCARDVSWYSLNEGDGQCIHIRMPYTFEYWTQYCKPHIAKEELSVIDKYVNDTISNNDAVLPNKNENNVLQNVHFKLSFYSNINKAANNRSNSGLTNQQTQNRCVSSNIITMSDFHPPN